MTKREYIKKIKDEFFINFEPNTPVYVGDPDCNFIAIIREKNGEWKLRVVGLDDSDQNEFIEFMQLDDAVSVCHSIDTYVFHRTPEKLVNPNLVKIENFKSQYVEQCEEWIKDIKDWFNKYECKRLRDLRFSEIVATKDKIIGMHIEENGTIMIDFVVSNEDGTYSVPLNELMERPLVFSLFMEKFYTITE